MKDKAFFRGVSQVTVDDKGRLRVPARTRELLENLSDGSLIATADRDGCLLLYPSAAWSEVEERLYNLPTFDKSARFVKRLTLGYATACDIDKHGRILLTSPLREFAKLGKHGLLFGQGSHFELWDSQQWTQQREIQMKQESDSREIGEALGDIRL